MTPIAPRFHCGMHIDIYSDVICPWCYLGHRRFTAALDVWREDWGARVRRLEIDDKALTVTSGAMDFESLGLAGPLIGLFVLGREPRLV